MLCDFCPQKIRTALQLLDAIDAIFDADPAIESDSCQSTENRIVVVETLADFAMS